MLSLGSKHPKPAVTSRWRLVLDRAKRRRPSAAPQRDVVAAYRLGCLGGINAAADGWTSTYH
jgi:hypothetical protein